jgi:hypothetical protein
LENVFSLEEAAGWEDAKVSMAAAESMNVMNLRAQLNQEGKVSNSAEPC